jgi:membrane protease YdiL (CAAX protease family)
MPAEKWRTWTLKAALETLLDMGESGSALDLVRTHKDLELDATTRARLARALHASGSTDEALEQMRALGRDAPTGAAGLSLRRQIFEFQLEHGTRDDAVAAYRTLRDGGYHADPYGHLRLSLFLRYPTAPWHADELLGIGALLLLLVVLGLLPLIVVAPLHYWSLARRVRMGAKVPSDDTPWGFGDLWYALAVISVAGGVATYLGAYDQFREWFDLDVGVVSGIADDRDLGRAFLYTQLLTFIGLLPLALRSGVQRRLLGTWSFGHSACAGIGLAFLLLMANGIVRIATAPAVALGGDTIRAMQGIYGLYGTGGLLLVSAIAAPVVEEFVFRGVFLRVAARHVRFWIAAALQAGVFIALHDQAGAYFSLFALALVAAWLAHRSGGLIAPIALHATNNVMASLAITGVTRSVSVVPG